MIQHSAASDLLSKDPRLSATYLSTLEVEATLITALVMTISMLTV